jgi:hypothetical protein
MHQIYHKYPVKFICYSQSKQKKFAFPFNQFIFNS